MGLSFFIPTRNVIGYYLGSPHVQNNASEGELCTKDEYHLLGLKSHLADVPVSGRAGDLDDAVVIPELLGHQRVQVRVLPKAREANTRSKAGRRQSHKFFLTQN